MRHPLILILCISTVSVLAIDNGLGLTPPMGWRSWNCYGGNVNDTIMRKVVDVMVDRSRSVNGKPTSLVDLGYITAGLDDNWQACNTGVNNSFHDSNGNPLINTKTFPDMKSMCDYAHSKGAKMGWYHNNCICDETQKWDSNYIQLHYQGDVKAIFNYGYDEVKLDGCGEFVNLTLWANLINETGRPVLIENCHWGGDPPTLDYCPFNYFRTSDDVRNNWESWYANLQTVIPFLDPSKPLSRPGCWAYPDMLEVGNMNNNTEERAHFGAWIIVSAPLILGFDLTNSGIMDRVWPLITNTEALAVSQTWAGHPGRLLESYFPPPPNSSYSYLWGVACNANDATQSKFSYDSTAQNLIYTSTTGQKLCIDYSNSQELTARTCGATSNQKFTFTNNNFKTTTNGQCIDVLYYAGPEIRLTNCNNACEQHFTINTQTGVSTTSCSGFRPQRCMAIRPDNPFSGWQLWGKPQPNNTFATVLINNDPYQSYTVTVNFTLINITGSASVRDIWNKKDLGTFQNSFTTDRVDGHDSRFYLFTPK